jgi:hypothetical protein
VTSKQNSFDSIVAIVRPAVEVVKSVVALLEEAQRVLAT